MQMLKSLPKGTEAFESAARRRLITNIAADRLLVESPQAYMESWPVWTRSVVAYPPAGATFGHALEYSCRPARYVLDTYEYRGVRGVALLFEDFEMKPDHGTYLFVPKGKPTVLENFPQESGWYGMHASGIPLMTGAGEKRFLLRMEGARIGAVVRDFGPDGRQKLDVFLHHRLSQKLGAILEEPVANVIPLEAASRK